MVFTVTTRYFMILLCRNESSRILQRLNCYTYVIINFYKQYEDTVTLLVHVRCKMRILAIVRFPQEAKWDLPVHPSFRILEKNPNFYWKKSTNVFTKMLDHPPRRLLYPKDQNNYYTLHPCRKHPSFMKFGPVMTKNFKTEKHRQKFCRFVHRARPNLYTDQWLVLTWPPPFMDKYRGPVSALCKNRKMLYYIFHQGISSTSKAEQRRSCRNS